MDKVSSSLYKQLALNISLRQMFTTIVEEYDTINRIVTFELDDVWRKRCAANCTHCKVIVDLCCGTGRLLKQISQHTGFESLIVGLDFSRAMLKKAICNNHKDGEERRVNMQAPKDGVGFILADAGYLPLKDESVDCVCISFSLRNLIYKNPQARVHLKEIIRVLKPGGRFVCVETSQPKWLPLRMLYHIYLQKCVPFIGWLISGRKGPYNYLGASAINFPPAEKIRSILLNAGFRKVTFKHLTFGIVALHVGIK
jgi:demethylmenaquinone methyltransferase/2-methoxy-6-polyprenyl-1,4-benzoquinol methylase